MPRLAAILVTALLACGGSKKPPPPAPSPPVKVVEGGLTVDVDPPDAEIEVDGSARGVASALAGSITLAPGAHQIVIRKVGFEIWRGEVEIKDQTEKIQVKLVPTKK